MSVTYPKVNVLQLSYDGDKNKTKTTIPPQYMKPKPSQKIGKFSKSSTRKERGVTKWSGDKLLDNVISVIANQSEQLCLNEELWKMTKNQKRLVESCMTPSGRSTGAYDCYPTIDKIQAWSDEKRFWLTYLPRQQRIFNYESGKGSNYYFNTDAGGNPKKEKLHTESISFDERCRQYSKQVEFEEKVMTQFDKKYQVQNDRLRNRELALTLHRYKDFTRSLMGNLKETQTETNNMGAGGKRLERRYQQCEMERIEQGYNILKDLYAMNPPLVIQLASQHVKGPPGKRWMGLSRDDISEVLDHLAKGKSNPDYTPFPHFSRPNQGRDLKTGAYSIRDYLAAARGYFPSRSEFMASTAMANACSNIPEVPHPPQVIMRKARGEGLKKNPNRRLKPHQLLPLHIPGPDRLHQNVCVRPYSADLDGPHGDVDGQTKLRIRKKRSKRKSKKVRPQTPQGLVDLFDSSTASGAGEGIINNETGTPGDSEVETETLDFDSGDDGEGITIESFIPCFMNSH